MYRFQIVHLKNAFVLKDEIGSSDTLRVWKNIDFVTTSNSLASCIKQHGEVFTVVSFCSKDVFLVIYRFEDIILCQHLQLTDKVGATQDV